MAAANGIMSMFSNVFGGNTGNGTAQPATPATPATPGNIPANTPITGGTPNGAAPNGVIPAADPNAPAAAPTPFADFQDLWKTTPTDPNAPAPGVFGNIDPKKFMEAAGKIDFSKAVTPEQLTAITAGGDAAQAAFAAAMNTVAQGVYAQSAFATTKIVEQAINKTKDAFLAELPQHIKKQTVTDSLRSENPIFNNPAVAPIISALEAQMTVKFPNATAPEITAMARQYVEQLGTSFAPKPAPLVDDGKGKKNDTDWSTFLN